MDTPVISQLHVPATIAATHTVTVHLIATMQRSKHVQRTGLPIHLVGSWSRSWSRQRMSWQTCIPPAVSYQARKRKRETRLVLLVSILQTNNMKRSRSMHRVDVYVHSTRRRVMRVPSLLISVTETDFVLDLCTGEYIPTPSPPETAPPPSPVSSTTPATAGNAVSVDQLCDSLASSSLRLPHSASWSSFCNGPSLPSCSTDIQPPELRLGTPLNSTHTHRKC